MAQTTAVGSTAKSAAESVAKRAGAPSSKGKTKARKN
jgi:hypothetical protein